MRAESDKEDEEWRALFDLQHQREQPWVARWQAETGKPMSVPDYGAMLAWILDKADAAVEQNAALVGAQGEILSLLDNLSPGPSVQRIRALLAAETGA